MHYRTGFARTSSSVPFSVPLLPKQGSEDQNTSIASSSECQILSECEELRKRDAQLIKNLTQMFDDNEEQHLLCDFLNIWKKEKDLEDRL